MILFHSQDTIWSLLSEQKGSLILISAVYSLYHVWEWPDTLKRQGINGEGLQHGEWYKMILMLICLGWYYMRIYMMMG